MQFLKTSVETQTESHQFDKLNMYYFFNNLADIGKKRDNSVVVAIESQFAFENLNYLYMLGKHQI